MKCALRKQGKPLPYIQEHVDIAQRRAGFPFPSFYLEIIKEFGQLRIMDAPKGHYSVSIMSIYELDNMASRLAKLSVAIKEPDFRDLGIYPFAGNSGGAIYWDTRYPINGDYKVIGEHTIEGALCDAEEQWVNTESLIDDCYALSQRFAEENGSPVIGDMMDERTSQADIDAMIADFLSRGS